MIPILLIFVIRAEASGMQSVENQAALSACQNNVYGPGCMDSISHASTACVRAYVNELNTAQAELCMKWLPLALKISPPQMKASYSSKLNELHQVSAKSVAGRRHQLKNKFSNLRNYR